jgi:alkaline phosphatase D
LDETGSYWKRVHVYKPNEMLSNQANFTLSCASALGGIWAGTWETSYGTMVLTQTGSNVSGTYEHSNGHIIGTVSGNVLTGTWSEAPTYSAANNDAGDVQLTLSLGGMTFTGGWRYGSSGSWTMNWNGTKIF